MCKNVPKRTVVQHSKNISFRHTPHSSVVAEPLCLAVWCQAQGWAEELYHSGRRSCGPQMYRQPRLLLTLLTKLLLILTPKYSLDAHKNAVIFTEH